MSCLANRLIHRERIYVQIINAPFVEERKVFKFNWNVIFHDWKLKESWIWRLSRVQHGHLEFYNYKLNINTRRLPTFSKVYWELNSLFSSHFATVSFHGKWSTKSIHWSTKNVRFQSKFGSIESLIERRRRDRTNDNKPSPWCWLRAPNHFSLFSR